MSLSAFLDDFNGAVSKAGGGLAGIVEAQENLNKLRGKRNGKVGQNNPYPKDDPTHYAPQPVAYLSEGGFGQNLVLGGVGLLALAMVWKFAK